MVFFGLSFKTHFWKNENSHRNGLGIATSEFLGPTPKCTMTATFIYGPDTLEVMILRHQCKNCHGYCRDAVLDIAGMLY